MALIVSISGIRGTIGGMAGENLTPIEIVQFSSAFGQWIISGKNSKDKSLIVVGRDARISGKMVSELIINTLIACGIDVIDLGLSTTPTVEMAVPHFKADGGIIITASHNPMHWNALKLLNSKGEFISANEGEQLVEIIGEKCFEYAPVEKLGTVTKFDFIQQHIESIVSLPLVQAEKIRKAKLKAVVDGINSVGAIAIPKLLERLGVEVILLNGEPNGIFAHNPEPLEQHLGEIMQAVTNHKANLGIVVDPDVDRLALIDEKGNIFGEEYTIVAAADYVLRYTPGNTVSNLSSSRALRDITHKYGYRYEAAAVGEVNVVAKMKETNAIIGGEGNGGVIYPELHYGRDGLVGIALILSHLADSGKSLSQLKKDYPNYVMIKSKIDLSNPIDFQSLAPKIASHFSNATLNTIDGIKIDLPEGWVHLRKSNTEPIIRIYAEAENIETAQTIVAKVQQLIK